MCYSPSTPFHWAILFLDTLSLTISMLAAVRCMYALHQGTTAALNRLQACLASIRSWMLTNKLELNSDKTEFFYIGNKWQLSRFPIELFSVKDFHSCAPSLWKNLATLCPLSHFSCYLQGTSEDTYRWLGLFPLDTDTPDSPLMPWNCFIDFAIEH